MLILFIILTMVFSSYVIKTSTAEFEEQIDVQLRGITTQIDNTLRLADDIALQIAATQDLALGLSIQIGVSDTSCTRAIIHFKVSTFTSSSTDVHTSKNVAPASDCILALSLIRSASFSYFLLHIYYLTVKKFTEKNCRQIFSFDSSLNITHITIIFTLILISQFPSYSEASISQPPVPQWHPFPQKYLSSIWNPYCDYDCPLT